MRTRHIYLAVTLAAASAALGFTLVAAPPAVADCVSSRGPNPVTLCSQGDSRVSNTTPLTKATPYIPLDCDVDWLCDEGLGIALGND